MGLAEGLRHLNDRFNDGANQIGQAHAREARRFEESGPRFKNPVLRALERLNYRHNVGMARIMSNPDTPLLTERETTRRMGELITGGPVTDEQVDFVMEGMAERTNQGLTDGIINSPREK